MERAKLKKTLGHGTIFACVHVHIHLYVLTCSLKEKQLTLEQFDLEQVSEISL